MNIGLIGAGHVGEALASRLVQTGHQVKIANSRGPDTLEGFARKTGAQAVSIDEVSPGVDVLIIAIPMARILDLPKTVIAALPCDAIVVDAGNYYPWRDGAIPEFEADVTESQWVSRQLGVGVIKAFNNVIAPHLDTGAKPEGDSGRIAIPVAGDDPGDRATIMQLAERMGFSAVDAGPLSESWRQQPGQPVYCTDPTREELPALLRRANRVEAPRNRDRASKLLAKLPDDYAPDQLVKISRLFAGLDRINPQSWWALIRLGIKLLRHPR